MSSSKDVRKYKFFDTHKITESLVSEGAQLIYCRETLYPIVEAQVRIREKNRDQLGDIEKTILAILQTCPASPDSVSRLMGVGGGKLFPTIIELEGRGLIEQGRQGIFKLSELGLLSVQYGVEVVDVDRALLLCGITGKLLPRNLYSVQRLTPAELKQRARNFDLVPEENSIKLSSLNLSKIPDRRAVNLTDEAMEIVGILEYKPAFLVGILAFYLNKANRESGEVIFPDETIDWLPLDKYKDFASEPLGFSSKKQPQEVVREIKEILNRKEAKLASDINLDIYMNPVVNLESLSSSLLDFKYKGKSLLSYIGTDKYRPVPIGQFPFGGEKGFQRIINGKPEEDLLYGRTISFYASSQGLKSMADYIRCMDHALLGYFKTPSAERRGRPLDAILEKLAQNGLDLNLALDCGRKYGGKNLKDTIALGD